MSQITILDGGIGRELKRIGAPFKQPEWSALSLMEAPESVERVHTSFIEAGADIVTTNSYAVVPFHIGEERFQKDGHRLAALSGQLARQAAEKAGRPVKVAGVLPPVFGSYRPDFFEADKAGDYLDVLIDGLSPYVDFWLAETQSLIEEALITAERVQNTGKPFWLSFSVEDKSGPEMTPRLRSEEPVDDAIQSVCESGFSIDAILFNCSQPQHMAPALKKTRETLEQMNMNIQTGAYANTFPPKEKRTDAAGTLSPLDEGITPEVYLDFAQQWVAEGATIIGGCCGIGPEHIAALAKELR